METRPLGETGHDSTVMTFGTIALNWLEQEGADQMVELVLDHGVNHFDVAPMYGDAELKAGAEAPPVPRRHLPRLQDPGTGYEGTKRKMEASFDRLGVDTIDLYQVHGLEYEEELDRITADDGALEAMREGRWRHRPHRPDQPQEPQLILDAIDRIDDLETLMFPLNPSSPAGTTGPDYQAVLDRANEEGIGTLVIKAFAKGSWPSTDDLLERNRPYANWYEPVDSPDVIRERFDFAASQDVTSVVSAGDPKLVAMILDAASRYDGMDEAAQRFRSSRRAPRRQPVPEQLHH